MAKASPFILIAAAYAVAAPATAAEAKPVMRVTAASATIVKKGGPVRVCARGAVPTTGWTRPVLTPRIYVQSPPDGIWDFDFSATPPRGPAGQMVSTVRAEKVWSGYYKGLKGVRVHGARNSVVARLGTLPTACPRGGKA